MSRRPGDVALFIPDLKNRSRLRSMSIVNRPKGAGPHKIEMLRVRPKTLGRIAEFSEHEAD
jgi:hypothetical protein